MVFSELRPFGILDRHMQASVILHAHWDKVFWIPLGVPFRVTRFHAWICMMQDHLVVVCISMSFKVCPSFLVILSFGCL